MVSGNEEMIRFRVLIVPRAFVFLMFCLSHPYKKRTKNNIFTAGGSDYGNIK